MKMKKRKDNGFEVREALGSAYWADKRWKLVRKLRTEGKDTEANGVVQEIRSSWGIE